MSFGGTVLCEPDLFPGRIAGEGWGEERLLLELAGEPLEVYGLSPAQQGALRQRYGPLCRSPSGGAAAGDGSVLGVFRADARDFLPPVPGRELRMDVLHQEAEVRLASCDLMALLALGASPGGALWTPADGDAIFLGAFENCARVIMAYRLLARGGLLLHSAGVVDGGVAHLFAGRSGAGKTTLARLSRAAGKEVLSDDINVVAPSSGGELMAERLPFAGDLGTAPGPPRRLPLGGVYLLRQGPVHQLGQIPPARAIAGLLACCPFVNADPYRLDAVLHALESLLGGVEIRQLTFRPDDGFWAKLADGGRE